MTTHGHRRRLWKHAIALLLIALMAVEYVAASDGTDIRTLSDIATQRQVPLPARTMRLAASGDGTKIAVVVGSGDLSILNVASGKAICKTTTRVFDCQQLKFSASGDVLLCQGGTGLLNSHRWFEVRRTSDGTLLFSNNPQDYRRLFGAEDAPIAWAADLSPDGTTLLLAGGAIQGVRCFDLTTRRWKPLALPRSVIQQSIEAVFFGRAGNRVMCISAGRAGLDDPKLFVLTLPELKVQASYTLRSRGFAGLGMNDEIIVSSRTTTGSLRLSNLSTDVAIPGVDLPGEGVEDAVFFSGGSRVAVLVDGTLSVWNIRSGREEARLRDPRGRKQFRIAAEGDTLVTAHGDGPATVWGLRSDQTTRTVRNDGSNK